MDSGVGGFGNLRLGDVVVHAVLGLGMLEFGISACCNVRDLVVKTFRIFEFDDC